MPELQDPRVAQIPSGPYCYDAQGTCPFWGRKHLTDGVSVVYCSYLRQGDVSDLTDQAFDRLKEFHRTSSDEDIWGLYPLDLLWDRVKECGENDES